MNIIYCNVHTHSLKHFFDFGQMNLEFELLTDEQVDKINNSNIHLHQI